MLVIGDIHGSFKTFKKLLRQYPNEKVCLVGDLVDRGPDSVEVVDLVMKNPDRIQAVRGNHEHMMIEFYRKNGGRPRMWDIWLENGGQKVYEAYKYKYGSDKLADHLFFLENLPFYIEFKDLVDPETGRYLVVSHSIITSPDIEACVKTEGIIWGRHFPEEDPSNGKWFNAFGHTPVDRPIITDWFANLDTGCCFHGKQFEGDDGPRKGYLTAMRWPSKEIIQVLNVDVGQNKERDADSP